jgi:16S rRNA (cytosine967-C5)-methyltransferase
VNDAWDVGLAHEDAAQAQAMLGLCLRNWGRLQAWVRPRLKNPDREIPLGSRIALALGLAQLAWLPGILTHAAVNEAVELAADRDLGFPPHKGLANALLRQASKDRVALRAELDALPRALDRTLFVDRILRGALAPRHQDDRMETLWTSLQEPPRPWFRALDEAPVPTGLEPAMELPSALRQAPEAAFPRDWLAEGHGMVQDLSSQALMDFQWDGSPRCILDVCAAPGGKTTSLARRWPGSTLVALESDAGRCRRLEQNLAQRGVAAEVIQGEAGAWLRQDGSRFDLILLDAPCSGTGTLRKHPELAWIGHRIDLPRLVRNQRALLEAALPRLAPGGLLIFAVCSWLPEEGLDHQAWLTERHSSLRPVPLWTSGLRAPERPALFCPDPLSWPGEGFQAFGVMRVQA